MGLDRNKIKEILLAATIFLGVALASGVFAAIAVLFVPENFYALVTMLFTLFMSAIGINIWNRFKKPQHNLD